MSVEPRAAVLILDTTCLQDALTGVVKSWAATRDTEVYTATSELGALAVLKVPRQNVVMIANWDTARNVAARVYQWVLVHRHDLHREFVFIGTGGEDELDELAHLAGCPLSLVHPGNHQTLIDTLDDHAAAHDHCHRTSSPPRPSLLLVEDEPLQRDFMSELLIQLGFSVTAAESGNLAIETIAHERCGFDVILSDWYMNDGSGGDLYEWLEEHRPALAQRCVFMSGAGPDPEFRLRAPGRPLLPKGQDSVALLAHLNSVAAGARLAA